ncbi:exostosin family protein [Actinidia rufa]|uniref:Exostosin family protein n=1 Tax=Actinidia rufa TaxID=165716 RepID=A0A7J0GGJ3_9ERIC|nr:exostosin family protein [Actinidia rufa]
MGSLTNKPRILGPHHNSQCTRIHQIGALALVAATFFLTRLFDQSSLNSCHSSAIGSQDLLRFTGTVGSVSWPHRGYGPQLSLKIYVYDEREIDGLRPLLYGRDGKISADACVKGQWGTQVKIHRMLLQSRFRTRKKEEADLFFVPTYVKCVRMMGGLSDKEINQTYVKVLSQMPYFQALWRTKPHFSTASAAASRPALHLLLQAAAGRLCCTLLLPAAVGTCAGCRCLRPPIAASLGRGCSDQLLTNHLLAGRAQGKIGRLQLVELAKQYPDKLESPELKFSGPDKLGRRQYFEHLCNAKFCLAPRGESSWTLRFYESFFVECVPVIISDYTELPFQNVIDYTQISIKWPWNRIGPELLEYLESIPDKDIERMIAYGRRVRCLWVYAPESEPCSAFNGIMWELQRKVRQFHQSPETFWLHNGSIVNRNLEEFSHWKPPLPFALSLLGVEGHVAYPMRSPEVTVSDGVLPIPRTFSVPVSIADLGSIEIDLRFASSKGGRVFVIVASILRFADNLGDDAKIKLIGPPERVISAFGPEVIGENLEGKSKPPLFVQCYCKWSTMEEALQGFEEDSVGNFGMNEMAYGRSFEATKQSTPDLSNLDVVAQESAVTYSGLVVLSWKEDVDKSLQHLTPGGLILSSRCLDSFWVV